MNIIDIRFSLDSSTSQPQIIELLKTNGIDCIQTSSGLCAKSVKSIAEIKEILDAKSFSSGITISQLDQSAEMPKDVESFISSA